MSLKHHLKKFNKVVLLHFHLFCRFSTTLKDLASASTVKPRDHHAITLTPPVIAKGGS